MVGIKIIVVVNDLSCNYAMNQVLKVFEEELRFVHIIIFINYSSQKCCGARKRLEPCHGGQNNTW